MNKIVEIYWKYFFSYQQDNWNKLLLSAEFAQHSAASEDIGMSPFEMYSERQVKDPLDLISGKKNLLQSVNDFTKR